MQHQAFVGRAHELGRIDVALAAALESRGRLVLVGGEAGIGKTRLAEELATRARGRGAAVLWGHCWEDGGAPTFWPWVQVLRGCLRDPATNPAALAFVAGAPHVDRLVRETLASSAPSPQSAATVVGRAEHERFAVLDAVTNFLRAIAETAPLCIVLDDLHGADEPSLILLRLVADEVRNMRALVLGTYRDPELHEPAGVDRLLADLTRHGDTLTLRGLAEQETAELIGTAGSAVPEPEEVRRFHQATAGNPLFLHELLGALEDLGQASPRDSITRLPFSLSGRVQDLITRRLKLLPTTTREALAVAALIGPEFDAGVLAAVLEIDEQGVLARLALAQAAGVAAYVGGTVSTYRFRNALWRKALNDALSVERRIALHHRIGETLERLHTADPDDVVAALAKHFLAAASGGDRQRAVAYARRAGERATTLLAYEEAIGHFARALDAITLPEPPGDPTRCELLLALADAARRAGDPGRADTAVAEATERARQLSDGELLARAALAFVPGVEAGRVDERRVALLEEALRDLPAGRDSLRARLLARLAWELYWSEARERRVMLADEALTTARASGDAAALAETLSAVRFALWEPEGLKGRLEAATEMLSLAQRVGDAELEIEGRHWRVIDLLELGDVAEVDREIEAHARLAATLRQPLSLWWSALWRGTRATMAGRFADAERLADEALSIGRRVQPVNAELAFHGQMFAALLAQGRLEHLRDAGPGVAEKSFLAELAMDVHSGLAQIHSELGRVQLARQEFELQARDDFARPRRSIGWLPSMCALAEACAFLGDRARAATLYDALRAWAGRCIVVGPAIACLGPASRHLGLLAATLARWDDAAMHFEDALRSSELLESPPFMARTKHDLAAMLLTRDGPGDRDAAQALLGSALETARALGMALVAARCEAKLAECDGGAHAAPAVPPAAPGTSRYVREGGYWSITFAGETVRLRHSVGLRHLAHMLSHPRVELPARFLASGSAVDRVCDAGSAGPLLDERAIREYRSHLRDLGAELDDAEAAHDLGRAERLQMEIDFIRQILEAGIDIHGQPRRPGGNADRARQNVTKAIRRAIEQIGAVLPALAAHLELTVRTGNSCLYALDPQSPVTWSVAPGG